MRFFYFLFLWSILTVSSGTAQTKLAASLFETYDSFREETITDRRFKHRQILALLEGLDTNLFNKQVVGQSVEGRDIYQIKVGEGSVTVLLWSQMHGNEPTATAALMDIFNFLSEPGSLTEVRDLLLQKLTIYVLPMLNPDGADRFERRNSFGIDINRDALRLQTPEGQILKNARDRLQPDWGFNLHDQGRYHSAGVSPHMASISFLAPAYNWEKDWNPVRTRAMQVIGVMNAVIQQYLPNKVGRYNDTFEPRAFGDNMQKWGTSTILIETGSLEGDREKQYLRKINYVAILSALQAIAADSYPSFGREDYEAIPFNRSYLHDLVIRDVLLPHMGQQYLVDLAFRHREMQNEARDAFYLVGGISDIGDLSTYYGYEEVDGSGCEIVLGKVVPDLMINAEDLHSVDVVTLLKDGYTAVQCHGDVAPAVAAHFPLNLIMQGASPLIRLGANPKFLLKKDGEIKYAVVNGFAYALDAQAEQLARWQEGIGQKSNRD